MLLVCAMLLHLLSYASSNDIAKCPLACTCPLDERGQWQVLCMEGGLNDPLPVLSMPNDAEILIVTAPEGKENALTLGPIFRGLPDLVEVHVVHSKVPALGEHSFWGLRKLKVLNVSHNSITQLRPTNFRGPEHLQSLDLSYNNIESVPSAVFRYLKHLKKLNLSFNRLPELNPRIFFGLSHLHELDLSSNPLGDLPYERFLDTPSLVILKCSACGLLTLSLSIFSHLQKLEVIDFSNNRFLTIPPLKIMTSISVLNLSGNHINRIKKDDLRNFPLSELYISHNKIQTIEEGTFENSSLKVLDLSYNKLSYLERETLDPILPQLKIIRFSGNSILLDQLQEILPKARQIRELGIGDLGLTRVPPDLLRRSRHLKVLNISSNYLTKFPHELLYSTPHLQLLDLSANSFRGLSENVIAAFIAMSSLNTVHLDRNPWQCEECHVKYMVKWLKSLKKSSYDSSCHDDPKSPSCLKCVGPSSLSGQYLIHLKEEKLGECSSIYESSWPYWDSKNDVVQSDEPGTPNDRESLANANLHKVAAFFKDHIALLVGVACGLVLAMMLVVITALACSRRQSAYYYTTEDVERKEKLMGRNNNESPVSSITVSSTDPSKVPPYEPMAISKVHSKTPIIPGNSLRSTMTTSMSSLRRPSIATIDELTAVDV